MKYIIALILSLSFINVCHAQNMNSGGPAGSHFYEELPYELINGKIIIEVEIAGHQKKFLLDTGAPCQISKEIADELNIKQQNSSKVIDAYGNANTHTIDKIKAIKLGNTLFNNIPTLIGMPDFFKCISVEGIIGSNLLRNCIVQFIGGKKTLVITDDVARLSLNLQNGTRLNAKTDNQSSPFIEVKIGDRVSGEFLFDSGDAGFLIVSNSYMELLKKQVTFQTLSTGYGANSFGENGGEKDALKYRIKFANINIGSTAFKNVITETTYNNHHTGTIGSKLLNYSTITLDYLHGKFYADPIKPENDLDEKCWPVSPSYSDHKLVTGIIWEKLKGSVKPGIQIIAIDDRPCEQIDFCSLLTQKPLLFGKEHATLTLKDDKGNVTRLMIDKE